jgi:hypothetical protein
MSALVILGSGFDIDLGLKNSCADYAKDYRCPIVGNETWSAFERTLRDEVIKWYNNGRNEEKAKMLNQLWRDYVKNISWFFTDKSDDFFERKNKKGRKIRKVQTSCAYRFLKQIKAKSKSKIYTFNYTNPYEYVNIPHVKEFIHLHGTYYKDTFNQPLLVMSQWHNIIFGIDECIPEDGINDSYIHPLVKKFHPQYKKTEIIADLLNAENVIFYGFSMGMIDYDYFSEFFNAICNSTASCKKIYYVTYNKEGLKDFIENLKANNLNIDEVLQQVSIIPIYTRKGFKNKDFRMMLRKL